MIFELQNELITRFGALTEELRFNHKPSGDIKKAPVIISSGLEPVRPGVWEEADDYPFVRVALYAGAFAEDGMHQPARAVAYAGIWTPGTMADGYADICTLLEAMGKIVDNPRFPPYLLGRTVPWTIGLQDSGEEGMQRHPFHYGAVFLEFTTP